MTDAAPDPPSGWVADAAGSLRRETIHHMGRRLADWDYRQPWIYMITIVLADRRSKALGELVVRRRLDAGASSAKPAAGEWLPVAAAKALNLAPDEVEAKIELSELGRAVLAHWLRIGEFTPEIKPLHCEVMPDHLHLFLQVTRAMARPLGNAIAGFKTGCEKLYRKLALSALNPSAPEAQVPGFAPEAQVPGFAPEAQVPGFAPEAQASGRPTPRLFASGFVDVILFRRGQFEREINYLRDNPRRLAIKLLFPDLFRVVRELRLKLAVGSKLALRAQNPQPSAGFAQAAPAEGKTAPAEGETAPAAGFAQAAPAEGETAPAAGFAQAAPAEGETAPAAGFAQAAPAACSQGRSGKLPEGDSAPVVCIGLFQALGNRFLLGRQLAQAQVSRSHFRYRRDARGMILRDAAGEPVAEYAAPEFNARRDELFTLAKHGAVIISPCVSEGEREIARLALKAGLPLVTLLNKGFSPLQKPSGRHFEACAEGRLLMLAPAAWPYQPGEKKMTRFDATAMNRLAQWLAGDGAAEINYHGMRPANIDELALAAVKADSRCAK